MRNGFAAELRVIIPAEEHVVRRIGHGGLQCDDAVFHVDARRIFRRVAAAFDNVNDIIFHGNVFCRERARVNAARLRGEIRFPYACGGNDFRLAVFHVFPAFKFVTVSLRDVFAQIVIFTVFRGYLRAEISVDDVHRVGAFKIDGHHGKRVALRIHEESEIPPAAVFGYARRTGELQSFLGNLCIGRRLVNGAMHHFVTLVLRILFKIFHDADLDVIKFVRLQRGIRFDDFRGIIAAVAEFQFVFVELEFHFVAAPCPAARKRAVKRTRSAYRKVEFFVHFKNIREICIISVQLLIGIRIQNDTVRIHPDFFADIQLCRLVVIHCRFVNHGRSFGIEHVGRHFHAEKFRRTPNEEITRIRRACLFVQIIQLIRNVIIRFIRDIDFRTVADLLRQFFVGIKIHNGIFKIIPRVFRKLRAFKFLTDRRAFEKFDRAVQEYFYFSVISPAAATERKPVAVPRLIGKRYCRSKNGIERRSDGSSFVKFLHARRDISIGLLVDD